MATVLSCNACNKQFENDSEQKLHYKSEWHRYNLKRKVQEHGAGNFAITRAKDKDEDDEENEQCRGGTHAVKDGYEEQRYPKPP